MIQTSVLNRPFEMTLGLDKRLRRRVLVAQLNSINPSKPIPGTYLRTHPARREGFIYAPRLRVHFAAHDQAVSGRRHRFMQAPVRALPQIPEQDLVWRMHFMFGAIVTRRAKRIGSALRYRHREMRNWFSWPQPTDPYLGEWQCLR